MRPDTKYIKIIKAGKMVVFLLTLSFYFVACEYEDVAPKNINGNKITITTSAATNITQSTAQVGGTLGDTYGRVVQDYGHCWDTISQPVLTAYISSNGSSDIGMSFSSNLENLLPGNKYYVRSYFKVDDIVVYGNETSFNTLAITIPVVETVEITNITSISALAKGKINDNGGLQILEYGICWNTSGNPGKNDFKESVYGGIMGSFSIEMTSLEPGTKYYVRAFATNQLGTQYGGIEEFTTSSN